MGGEYPTSPSPYFTVMEVNVNVTFHNPRPVIDTSLVAARGRSSSTACTPQLQFETGGK